MAEKASKTPPSDASDASPSPAASTPAGPASAPTSAEARQSYLDQVRPGQVWDAKLRKLVPFRGHHEARFTIRSKPPVTLNEQRGGVTFREGVGSTDDEDLARWFLSLGFEVTGLKSVPL